MGVDYGSMRAARAKADARLDADLESNSTHKAQVAALRAFLSSKIATTPLFFSLCDTNGNGQIDRQEWRAAIHSMKGPVPDSVTDELFDEFDADGSGEISYSEYVIYLLRDILRSKAGKVMELFRQMDEDKNGQIEKWEVSLAPLAPTAFCLLLAPSRPNACRPAQFRRAVTAMGLVVPDVTMIDEVFDSMDTDHSGTLSFNECYRKLRNGVGMSKGLDGPLRPSARRETLAEPRNRPAMRSQYEAQFLLQRAHRLAAAADEGSERRARARPKGAGRVVDAGTQTLDLSQLLDEATLESILPTQGLREEAAGAPLRPPRPEALSLPMLRPPALHRDSPLPRRAEVLSLPMLRPPPGQGVMRVPGGALPAMYAPGAPSPSMGRPPLPPPPLRFFTSATDASPHRPPHPRRHLSHACLADGMSADLMPMLRPRPPVAPGGHVVLAVPAEGRRSPTRHTDVLADRARPRFGADAASAIDMAGGSYRKRSIQEMKAEAARERHDLAGGRSIAPVYDTATPRPVGVMKLEQPYPPMTPGGSPSWVRSPSRKPPR